jgi:hypothetical protein
MSLDQDFVDIRLGFERQRIFLCVFRYIIVCRDHFFDELLDRDCLPIPRVKKFCVQPAEENFACGAIATPVQPLPNRFPGRSGDRADAAQCGEARLRLQPFGVIARREQQLRRTVHADCITTALLVQVFVRIPTRSVQSENQHMQICRWGALR